MKLHLTRYEKRIRLEAAVYLPPQSESSWSEQSFRLYLYTQVDLSSICIVYLAVNPETPY